MKERERGGLAASSEQRHLATCCCPGVTFPLVGAQKLLCGAWFPAAHLCKVAVGGREEQCSVHQPPQRAQRHQQRHGARCASSRYPLQSSAPHSRPAGSTSPPVHAERCRAKPGHLRRRGELPSHCTERFPVGTLQINPAK